MLALSSRSRALRSVLALVLVCFSLLAPAPRLALAHTIPGGLTLHQLSRAADVVAIARITRAEAVPKGDERVPKVEAEIIELLREGDAKKGKITFTPHRHADENYVVGEEVLLFLTHARSSEKTAVAAYETVEAVADRIVLGSASRAAWIDATRAHVALGKGPRASADAAALGRVTVATLGSDEPRLAGLALRDLTLAGAAPVIGAEDVPKLVALVEDEKRPISLRVGLLIELERRKLVEIGPRWVTLLRAAAPTERTTVIQAAASRAFVPAVTAELISLLDEGKADVAIAAARAVGAAGNAAAIPALERAVDKEPAELRYVALGSLRRIGSPEARAVITRAASSHSDPETRRVAATEQNLLGPAPQASAPSDRGPVAAAPEARKGNGTWILLGISAVVGLGALLISALRRGKAE